jgi:hypothetical protein
VPKGEGVSGKKLFDTTAAQSVIEIEGKGVTLVAAEIDCIMEKEVILYIKAKKRK